MDMITRFRTLIRSRAGLGLVGVGLAGAFVCGAFSLKTTFGASEMVSSTQGRWFVCSATLKPFRGEVLIGGILSIVSPYSGKKTGYVAESCDWTVDGKTTSDPSHVLLNDVVGKPRLRLQVKHPP